MFGMNGAQERTPVSCKISNLSRENRKKTVQKNENPGALAGASGVQVVSEVAILRGEPNTAGRIIQEHWGGAA